MINSLILRVDLSSPREPRTSNAGGAVAFVSDSVVTHTYIAQTMSGNFHTSSCCCRFAIFYTVYRFGFLAKTFQKTSKGHGNTTPPNVYFMAHLESLSCVLCSRGVYEEKEERQVYFSIMRARAYAGFSMSLNLSTDRWTIFFCTRFRFCSRRFLVQIMT